MASVAHFALGYTNRKMQKFRRRIGNAAFTWRSVRSLLSITFLLLSASDARRVVAVRSHPYRRVEIRVEDFSFSDRTEEKQPQVAIQARDIKGSELTPWPKDENIHAITWETADKAVKEREVETEAVFDSRMDINQPDVPTVGLDTKSTIKDDGILDLAVEQAFSNAKEDAALKEYMEYRTAVWWWSNDKTELTTQEQAEVLAVVTTMLLTVGLATLVLWKMAWYVWRVYRERQVLTKLFSEQDPTMLEDELREFPADLLSLRIKQIACVRLRHLQVVSNARDFKQQLEAIEFRETDMELVNLPLHPTTRKEMTFAEILTTVEEIACKGEQVAVEMMQLDVPDRWKRYIDEASWLKAHDERLQSLHLENARVQHIAEAISELLLAKVNSNEAIPKPVFCSLLASLRLDSGTPLQNATSENATSNELDAFSRCWSGSMTMSGSVSKLGGSKSKDDFNFLLKAYDEISEQQKVRQELRSAINTFQTAHEPEHEQLLLLENVDNRTSSQIVQRTKKLGAVASGATATSMRRLERWVDEAEMMEMTHVDEVENAQFMLEEARRDSFCAAVVSNEGKGLDSVQTLATHFVALGAKREDAILKAGEILANRSNMMLLVNSLRGMFDQLRKRDIMKMNERRIRDRAKAQEKRNRIAQKFHSKQQLIIEKIERTREAQRHLEEEARLQRRKEEMEQFRSQNARDRASFAWMITKIDVLVVLIIMAIVFFENVREVAFVKPLCQPQVEHHWWSISWWAPTSLQVFSCEVAYGIKILAILVVLGLVFFVVAQLNLVAIMLPVLAAIALYFLRDEWINMLFRLPLLLIIYGFNSGILYLLNRYEDQSNDDAVVKEVDKDIAVTPSKRWRMVLYVVFPLFSLLLTVVTGIGIACDAPEQCAASAYATTTSVIAVLWEFARGAYRL
ncbi:hypothetical protein PsorP6_008968 [Peronosclerospora sorghi]|uniref:Uncharacterized protein n=1 Tax=Peronosclerospora sorghi TaxID=230839 RepID=A0ACC0VZ83_9STRA|nr:hypothetical protein PsorP6_008968 [Peronosclerospora sorghi]